jgi:hypothetical protein
MSHRRHVRGRKVGKMKRRTVAILLSVVFALAAAAPAFAESTGYEGQPGNQSNGGGGGNTGYEGQPGNQSNGGGGGNTGYEGQPGNQSNG